MITSLKIFRILSILFLSLILCSTVYAQRILIDEGFETGPYTTDSIPIGWAKFKVNGPGACTTYPFADWRVRDSGRVFCNTNPSQWGYRSQSHNSLKSVNIPWTATTGSITDDWLFTDSLNILTGDSLIFWVQLGTHNAGGTYYLDSLQIWVTSVQAPTGGTRTKLATVTSLPLAQNGWQNFFYLLSPFNGQKVYIGFRYNMNVSLDGIKVNVDDVFVGNRSVSGITYIGNTPVNYDLMQNYPNPFNPITNIKFDIPKSNNVKIIIYNALGKEVTTLVNEKLNTGSYQVDWNALDYPSGVYFYKLVANDYVNVKKMVLVK